MNKTDGEQFGFNSIEADQFERRGDQSKPRKREYVYMAIVAALFILMARLEATDVSAKVIEEKRATAEPAISHPIGYSASMTACAGYSCEQTQYVYTKEKP